VYNEAVRGGIHGYILLIILEFYAPIHSCALDRFVLPRAIDNHERIILSKIRDSLIRFEIIISIIILSNRLVFSDMMFFRPTCKAKITYRGFSN